MAYPVVSRVAGRQKMLWRILYMLTKNIHVEHGNQSIPHPTLSVSAKL